MLTTLLSQHAGIVMDHVVSVSEPKSNPSDSGESAETVALTTSAEPTPLHRCFLEFLNAARAKDFEEADRKQADGVHLIKTLGDKDFDEIGWTSICLGLRATCGDLPCIETLHHLSAVNPENPQPLRSLAQIARLFKEYGRAGDLCSKAAQVDSGNFDHRVLAAKDYRAAKRWDLAITQLEMTLKEPSLTESVRVDALKEMFWSLKESGDAAAAFCFAEAALQVFPTDSDFRFDLAYAYGEDHWGYREHDYRDLAIFQLSAPNS